MKKTVLTFGLITGGILMPGMYLLMCLARNNTNFDISKILVYAALILLFIMVFMSIKSYRDNALGGFITFGRAFKVGILFSLVTTLSYIVVWIILYNPIFKDFMEQHSASLMEHLKTSGASAEEIASKLCCMCW
jgi:hypothetical protein